MRTVTKRLGPGWELWLFAGGLGLVAVAVLLWGGIHPLVAGMVGWYYMLLALPTGERRLGLWFPLMVGVTFCSVFLVAAVLWLAGATLTIGVPK